MSEPAAMQPKPEGPRPVFISYASEDGEAAGRLAAGLRHAGVEVWFDQRQLAGGDDWDASIREQIRTCFLFVPVISANTQKRLEGYFRREWQWAADRTQAMARGRTFLLPVYLGRRVDRNAEVPEEFRKVQWTCLADGQPTAEFLERLRKLTTGGSPRVPAAEPEQAPVPAAPAPRPWRGRMRLIAGLAVLLIGAILVATVRPRAAAPAPPAVAAKPEPRSVAVLPLRARASDAQAQSLAEAIQADCIASMSRQLGPVVSPREATLSLPPSERPGQDAARLLHVASVVSGSVARSADRLQVQIEISSADTPGSLWSKAYDVDPKDAARASAAIADEVARIDASREARGTYASARFTTANATAADLFSKAWQLIKATDSSEESLEQGVELAEECVQVDPGFTTAEVLLTQAQAQLFELCTDPQKRSLHAAEAGKWAEKASRIAQGGDTEVGLAIYNALVRHDSVRALEFIDHSLRMLPNEAYCYHLRARVLEQSGRLAEALEDERRAVTLDPTSAASWESVLDILARLRRAGDWASAWRECKAANPDLLNPEAVAEGQFELSGTLPTGPDLQWRTTWLMRAGRPKEALEAVSAEMADGDVAETDRMGFLLEKADILRQLGRDAESADASRLALSIARHLKPSDDPDPSTVDGYMAKALARVGRAEEATLAAERYLAAVSAPDRQMDLWRRETEVAQVYAILHRNEACVALLTKLLGCPSGLSVFNLKLDPVWAGLRNDPGFEKLLSEPSFQKSL